MAERFLKLNLDTDEADFLASHHPNAFILLYLIAKRARRILGSADGLIIGDALIGSGDLEPGLSRQNFRTALAKLVELGHVEIIDNGKGILKKNEKRKNLTIKVTIKGMLVNLCKSTIWDINFESPNHESNQRVTNDQPTGNHKEEGRRKKKKDHPSIPSGRIDDDLSFSEKEKKIEIVPGIFLTPEILDSCLKIKGDIEKVREAIAFIQASPRRKHEITDWPNTLARWKTDSKKNSARIEEHIAYSEKICREFSEFKQGDGWRCYAHLDRKKDQKGLLFESESAYQEAFFVALVDGEFQAKCEDFIKKKKMRVSKNH